MAIVPHAGPHSSPANTHSPLSTYHHPNVFQLMVAKLNIVALTSGDWDTNRNTFFCSYLVSWV